LKRTIKEAKMADLNLDKERVQRVSQKTVNELFAAFFMLENIIKQARTNNVAV